MTKTVKDNALLLEVIAGPDGFDDRQPPSMAPESLQYSKSLGDFLATSEADKPLKGFKIGVLKEGFALPEMDANVEKAVRSAVSDLQSLGGEVVDISLPSHEDAALLWMCGLPLGGAREGLLGDITGRKLLYMTDRAAGPNPKLSQEAFDALSPGGQTLYMRYLYVADKYGAALHAKTYNLLRQCSRAYDAALASVDVLVMPTLPQPPARILQEAKGPLEKLSRTTGMVSNTAPFNSTGHPALTLPVGFVPAMDDANVKLPVGMQLVGKQFDDLTCLKVAAAWERAKDWKTLTFAG